MDLRKIFMKGACPTSIGGQAILEGIMMRGPKKTAIAIRLADGRIHIKTEPTQQASKLGKMPIIRGVVNFVSALVMGTKVLMYSADVLEKSYPQEYEKGKFDSWVENKLGKEKAWNILMIFSVVLALIFSVGIFMLLPTVVTGWMTKVTDNILLLNLAEGFVRILLFIVYIWAISKMKDIEKVFQYHGAEHKTIHCYENGLELTPANVQTFYTLHPRCGTSFLMFVMVIAILVHCFMGWPNVWLRMGSRIIVLPLIAGLSYELLKWAGRSDNWLVKALSLPGIYLQKLTTKEPNDSQVEVAIAAVKAVLPDRDDEPFFEGICDLDGRPIKSSDEADEEVKISIEEGTGGEASLSAEETDQKKEENVSENEEEKIV